MKRFVAVYDEAAVRDTQICKEDPNSVSPEMDDVWEDWPNAPVYIGLFAGVDEAGATKAACETESCNANCIRLIPVGDYDEEFHYLLKFAAGAEFWTDGLPAEHLRALWMSYCFHEALTVDMPEYAAKLEILFNHLVDELPGVCQNHGQVAALSPTKKSLLLRRQGLSFLAGLTDPASVSIRNRPAPRLSASKMNPGGFSPLRKDASSLLSHPWVLQSFLTKKSGGMILLSRHLSPEPVPSREPMSGL